MLGDRNTVEVIPLGFLNPDAGPYFTIREDGMHVQVAGKAQVFSCIRKLNGSTADMFMTMLGKGRLSQSYK